MELLQKNRCFKGEQRIYGFHSEKLRGETKFGIFLPEKALKGESCAALYYLAGLTCTEETFVIKAHAQRLADELGLILITPDTSPRGEGVATGDSWDLGIAAGFYINATQQPWASHYQMQSFLMEELYPSILANFPVDAEKIGVFGHSMGGHGALTLAYKYPEKFKSVSAFAPICAPSQCPWGEKAFGHYLGPNKADWLAHDAVELVKSKGPLFSDILIDQGLDDQFYFQLNPKLYQQACDQVGQKLTLREHDGYDHGYFFIQTFIDDHLNYHHKKLV